MKIEKNKQRKIPLSKMESGDCFENAEGDWLIMSDYVDNEGRIGCVFLDNGYLTCLDTDADVMPITLKAVEVQE